MMKTETIIWRAETRMDIERKHPEWQEELVTRYLDTVQELAFGDHHDTAKILVAYDVLKYLCK